MCILSCPYTPVNTHTLSHLSLPRSLMRPTDSVVVAMVCTTDGTEEEKVVELYRAYMARRKVGGAGACVLATTLLGEVLVEELCQQQQWVCGKEQGGVRMLAEGKPCATAGMVSVFVSFAPLP